MAVGKGIPRVDAYAKVTGQAKYTEDLLPVNALTAKILHSTIANGYVLSIDTTKALIVEGVVAIFTCFDVPDHSFPTAGHPWSTEKSHQDVADRKLLNERVRYYGDDIAVVVAENEVAAERALEAIKVEYQVNPPLLTVEEALASQGEPIHETSPDNILKRTHQVFGSVTFDALSEEEDLLHYKAFYQTPPVQHCHLEKPMSYAYMDNDRIIVVSSTQIPHIARRVVGQALGIPWGKIRIVKPYIGGGFGNKQEVLYEPLNAFLTWKLGGRCIKLDISREETFVSTRIRHAIGFELESYVRPNGQLVGRRLKAFSNQGGYASHGHAVVANSVNNYRQMYQDEKVVDVEAFTVYTNLPSAGAMRAYGIPQITFAAECHMQDMAEAFGFDPIKFRMDNAMRIGFVDPGTGIACHSNGLRECVQKGRELIGWDDKYEKYKAGQTGDVRKGIGMAIFCYKTGVYPISLETASARLILNQDGSAMLQMGATEIGQGADTVFTQMASETTGLRLEDIHLNSTQDTDVTPFDTGAYASRQTYVSGKALKETALLFREKILDYASWLLEKPQVELTLRDSTIYHIVDDQPLISMADLAMEAFYNLEKAQHITAEVSKHCKENTYSFGVCFAEIEVDIPIGEIKVVDIINVHDSGVIINPKTAEAQVHGGMSMGLAYALSEHLLYDSKGRVLNDNFLDYKLPTSMDTPELRGMFVETHDPTGPYGNKSLGEPPTIPQAPAIRNALFNATGVSMNVIPITPQRLIEAFIENGLLKGV